MIGNAIASPSSTNIVHDVVVAKRMTLEMLVCNVLRNMVDVENEGAICLENYYGEFGFDNTRDWVDIKKDIVRLIKNNDIPYAAISGERDTVFLEGKERCVINPYVKPPVVGAPTIPLYMRPFEIQMLAMTCRNPEATALRRRILVAYDHEYPKALRELIRVRLENSVLMKVVTTAQEDAATSEIKRKATEIDNHRKVR